MRPAVARGVRRESSTVAASRSNITPVASPCTQPLHERGHIRKLRSAEEPVDHPGSSTEGAEHHEIIVELQGDVKDPAPVASEIP